MKEGVRGPISLLTDAIGAQAAKKALEALSSGGWMLRHQERG